MKKFILLLVFIPLALIVFSQEQKPFLFTKGNSPVEVFQMNYKLGQFNAMLEQTSPSSIKTFGKDKLLKLYQDMDFGYKLEKLLGKNDNPDGTITLNFQTNLIATKHVLRITLDKDMKIIIKSLNLKNPFI